MKITIRFILGLAVSFLAMLSGCDDDLDRRFDAGAIRDMNPSSDAEQAGVEAGIEAGEENDDLGIAGDEVMDRGLAGGEAGEMMDCSEEVICDEDGRLRRCEEGEWVVESCPLGTSCDQESARCITDGCTEGVKVCDGENTFVECVDGEYGDPQACAANEQCIAGLCLSACDRAAANADYQGCEFWAVDMDNILDGEGGGPGAASSAVVLSNVSQQESLILIQDREGVIVHQRVLGAGETQSFSLPRADLIGSQLGGVAWHVSTDQPVLAYLFTPLQRTQTSSVDATLLIPIHALDDRYRVLTWPGQGYNQRGTMTIVAVDEEPTSVTVVLSEEAAPGVDFREMMTTTAQRTLSPSVGTPWTEVLERGEVWQLQSGPLSDLSGTEVIADRDIVLFAGTRCSNIPAGIPRCDHLEHQMLPLRNQGRSYVAPGGLPRASEETWYRVVATLDGTEVTSVPALPELPVTLGAGEVFTFSSAEPLNIQASAPVMVGMFLASADADADGVGDPSFVLLPPVEQFQSRYAFLTPDDFERDGLTLISSGETAVTLDGEPLAVEWQVLTDSTWQVAHVEIADGPHEISAGRAFGMIITGYDEEVSYAFTGGLNLEKIRESEPPPFEGVCGGGASINTPCQTGLMGACSAGRLSCAPGGEPSCLPVSDSTTERCNRLDDDCDGLIDESQCANFILERAAPESDRLILVEGEEMGFRVEAQGEAIGLDIEWSVDGENFIGETGLELRWTPLGFEEGPRVVTAKVNRDDRVAEISWLVLVNDAPSNTPVIWGKVTLPQGETVSGVTIELDRGPSEGELEVDPRGYYAIAAESGVYHLKLDTIFNPAPNGYPRGIITLAEDIVLDQLNVRRDIELPLAQVSGQVSMVDGILLPDTILDFDGSCFACSQRVEVNAMGRYDTLLFYATWEVNATPPESTGLPTRTVSDEEVRGDRPWDIIFPNVYTINALIVDQYDAPTSGVTIIFEGAEAQVEQSTDTEGRLSVNLPEGEYLVKLDTLFSPRPPQIGKGIVPLIETLQVSTNIENLRIPLPNAWVSGVVTGQGSGSPQEGVNLNFDGSCFACSGEAETDVNGAYGVPLLHGDYTIELTPDPNSDYVNQSSDPIAAYTDLTHDIVLEGPALVIDGTLLDPRGQAVAGIGIRSEGRTESQVTTDDNGLFQLRLLPGEYELKIDSIFGDRPIGAPRGIVEFWSGQLSASVTQSYVAPFSYISGRVQESAGDVVPSAALSFDGSCFACSQTAVSIEDGSYEATLFQGIYRIEVTPPAPLPLQTIEDIDCSSGEIILDINY